MSHRRKQHLADSTKEEHTIEFSGGKAVAVPCPRLGASCWYHHPERMEITQPRVASSELPWDHRPNTLYPERVASGPQDSLGGTGEMRLPRLGRRKITG